MNAEKIITDHQAAGRITPHQAKVLSAYIELKSHPRVAERLNTDPGAIGSTLQSLRRKGIVTKDGFRKPYRLIDPETSTVEFVKPEIDIEISESERSWMYTEYPKYQRERSEAARILGRSRLDICRMAISLGIDLRN